MNRFGEKLRMLRECEGMTLRGLAESLGYKTHTYLNEVELGSKDPSIELVLRVARYFNVSTDELLKDEIELKAPSKRKEK